jgi:oxalate decarboxylase/phosphoglucose isomerase-like protein (cupin superfamily)
MAGQGMTGQGRAGQGRAGQGRAGHDRAGQGRAWHGRAGHDRAGQGRAGQGRQMLTRLDAQIHVLPHGHGQLPLVPPAVHTTRAAGDHPLQAALLAQAALVVAPRPLARGHGVIPRLEHLHVNLILLVEACVVYVVYVVYVIHVIRND